MRGVARRESVRYSYSSSVALVAEQAMGMRSSAARPLGVATPPTLSGSELFAAVPLSTTQHLPHGCAAALHALVASFWWLLALWGGANC